MKLSRLVSMRGLIVGVGSIGKNHLHFLINRYGHCTAVDTNPKTLAEVQETYGDKVRTFSTIKEALNSLQEPQSSVAVVSNLGPDHFDTVVQLVRSGLRKIYLEKPMATSMLECQEIVDISREYQARIIVGFQRRMSGLVRAIDDVAKQELLGSPSSILVHGGALDISTTGIHWLDFASDLFNCSPVSVIGSGDRRPINPRSPALDFWGGTVTWVFETGQKITQVFDNDSSLAAEVLVYFKNAVIRVEDDFLEVGLRDEMAIKKFPQVTRCGPVVKRKKKLNQDLGLVDGREELFKLLEGEEDLDAKLVESATVTQALLAGLGVLESQRKTHLPVRNDGATFEKKWNAS